MVYSRDTGGGTPDLAANSPVEMVSSKRHIRRKSCQGKKAFPSIEKARYAAYLRSKKSGEKIVPYRCRFCRQWHIGHPPSGIQRKLGYR